MKKNVIIVLLVAVIFSAISVVSMIKDSKDQTLLSFANSTECRAQGDFKPEPFDNQLLAPNSGIDDQICINQNKIQTEKKSN